MVGVASYVEVEALDGETLRINMDCRSTNSLEVILIIHRRRVVRGLGEDVLTELNERDSKEIFEL
jgi:hypothetical protein